MSIVIGIKIDRIGYQVIKGVVYASESLAYYRIQFTLGLLDYLVSFLFDSLFVLFEVK